MDTSLVYWHWFIASALLIILELIIPGTVIMWFGIGAAVTGILLLLIPSLAMSVQLIIFSLVSVASLYAWRHSRFSEDHIKSDTPELNNRLQTHIGQSYILTEAIINGRGAIRVGDTAWRVISNTDMPEGTRVKIIGLDGILFKVEASH